MESSEPTFIERSAGIRRLVVMGGAAVITIVSFALIFVIFVRVPSQLFALWVQMSGPWKIVAESVYFILVVSFAVWMRKTRRLRGLRPSR
jgi:hypothetical protein